MRTLLLLGLPAYLLILLGLGLGGCTETHDAAHHVGTAKCATCHQGQHELWNESHHDLAMQEANADTVLGNFDDQTFTYHGVTSTFFRRDGRYFLRTDGPDGQLEDYPVKYCFGVTPLQQYLIEFPGGRLQASALCWDSRPAEQGGQRWFHLYPDENITHDDPLHWTRRHQTWNHQCASCHSTDLRRRYDPANDRYDTTWFELDVACEACHGPGSRHVAWAEDGAAGIDKGLMVPFPRPATWVFEPGNRIAVREPPLDAHVEVDACAPCHARRSVIHEQPALGHEFLDTHRPAALDQRLYHPDGQIQGEVYVWGSFVQSKMYHEGVTCSDCHDPHSLQLRAEGNALCTRCHLASEYDAASHHFHEPASSGSQCVDCHMPSRTYMVVDPRRDHSFRIPRPDLSVALGTPNACTACHRGRTAQWAADTVAGWFPEREWPAHFGEALHAAHSDRRGAGTLLEKLARDPAQPAIARASALELLGARGLPASLETVRPALSDVDPLVRRAALTALQAIAPTLRIELARDLLVDPVRSVRIEAARLIETSRPLESGVGQLPSAETDAPLRDALAEYHAALEINADQPWSHVNRALLHLARGDQASAEQSYLSALRIDPDSIEASANLADLYRELERDDRAEAILRSGLARNPDSAELGHALGLLLVRTKRLPEALHFLELAADRRPENARFGYVFAVALHTSGAAPRAITVLERTHLRHPEEVDVLQGLVAYLRSAGDTSEAQRYADKLQALTRRN